MNLKQQHKPAQTIALQWNICGAHSKYLELERAVNTYNPIVIALQETRCSKLNIFDRFCQSKYNWLLLPGPNTPNQNGVGLGIRKDVPHTFLTLKSSLQAVAAKIDHPFKATFVSVYIPPNTNAKDMQEDLTDLITEITNPFVLLGDFNAHNPLWGSSKTDHSGIAIETLTSNYNLTILNSGAHTRLDPATGQTSAIDLSIISFELISKLNWIVENDCRGSDHFPIRLNSTRNIPTILLQPKWIYNQADWAKFERQILAATPDSDNYSVEEFAKLILTAAETSIPRTSGKSARKAVPWWNPQVAESIKTRRKWLRKLRKIPDDDPSKQETLQKFKNARNETRKTIKEAKQSSWETFLNSLNPQTPSQELWRKVNAFSGKRRLQNHILTVDNITIDEPKVIANTLADYFEKTSVPPNHFAVKNRYKLSNSDKNATFNQNITFSELLWAINKGKGKSTGPDQISYAMLHHLPLSAKSSYSKYTTLFGPPDASPRNGKTGS